MTLILTFKELNEGLDLTLRKLVLVSLGGDNWGSFLLSEITSSPSSSSSLRSSLGIMKMRALFGLLLKNPSGGSTILETLSTWKSSEKLLKLWASLGAGKKSSKSGFVVRELALVLEGGGGSNGIGGALSSSSSCEYWGTSPSMSSRWPCRWIPVVECMSGATGCNL